jgi:AraC family transcriptional regulator
VNPSWCRLYEFEGNGFLAEIAVSRQTLMHRQAGEPGSTQPRQLASGNGWNVADVVCTCGPEDPPYEEQHREFAVAFVISGMFEQHSAHGRTLMTPGAVMLGSPATCFACSHTHARGDRCVSFWYSAEYFDRVLADVPARGMRGFSVDALPPLREISTLSTRATAAISKRDGHPWDELAALVATTSVALTQGLPRRPAPVSKRAESKVADAVRRIELAPDAALSLDSLADAAGISPYHFLRVFSGVCGVTPHQYVRRARLRRAAEHLLAEPSRIIDIALDSGFSDVSNFNHAFRAEFGVSPRRYRLTR